MLWYVGTTYVKFWSNPQPLSYGIVKSDQELVRRVDGPKEVILT